MRRRAAKKGKGRIIMVGHLPPDDVHAAWGDFNLAVHVPISENCGGVVEPMLAGVPVIAAKVGGLPEVVMDGFSGLLVLPDDARGLAIAIEKTLDDIEYHGKLAKQGAQLVSLMFDVRRTAREILDIYAHLLLKSPLPEMFDPRKQILSGKPS
jgi:glycosyltransferase involved in cell wall biosynthesis